MVSSNIKVRNLENPVGFIYFTTLLKYLASIFNHPLISDADVIKHVR
jgi:hypothetical protein